MKKIALIIVAALIGCLSLSAESTIYFFAKGYPNTDTKLFIDGKEVCTLNGRIKKTFNPGGYSSLKYPMEIHESCYRKITYNGEGKIIISCTMDYMNAVNGDKSKYKGEFPLDLEDGETYYLEFTNKGITDVQVKELKEKDALKKMKKDEELPAITFTKE